MNLIKYFFIIILFNNSLIFSQIKIEEIELSKEIQEISATKIRAQMRKEGKLK